MRRKTAAFDEVTKDGPIHLILGDGGRQANKPFLNTKPKDWAAVCDHTTYGWGSIEYLNATTARYEWIHTGCNRLEDRGHNFFDIQQNSSEVVDIQNQYFQ
jgi:hypothetical protein